MARHSSVFGVFASVLLAVGLLVTNGVGVAAATTLRGCYVVADVPSDGSWGNYGWYMYHTDGYDINPVTATLNDNVTHGMVVGLKNSAGYFVGTAQWNAGTYGNKVLASFAYSVALHPLARELAPAHGPDLHWQADYWGFGWSY